MSVNDVPDPSLQIKMDRFQTQVGTNMKNLRSSLRLTQEQLAEQAKVSTETIVKLENGRQWFSLESLIIICEALHTTPCQLFLVPQDDHLIPVEALLNFTTAYTIAPAQAGNYSIQNVSRAEDSAPKD